MFHRRTALILGGIALLLVPANANARKGTKETRRPPGCDPEAREQISERLARVTEPETWREIREKHQRCAETGRRAVADDRSRLEHCGSPTYAGDLFYERLRCCGYEPQKKLFNCPVEIRHPAGFGAFPVPGSYEYVLTCVQLGGAWRAVALDRVHVANGVSGKPPWYTAVTAAARSPLAAMPLDGRTLNARSILSWNLSPQSDCNYRPIWGNVIEYRIRLDPSDDTPPEPPPGKTVFVTSTTQDGDLGGFAGANATCQARAVAAGLAGNFEAWLSGRPDGFGGQNARDFLTHSAGPYRLVDGTKVADDWADLIDGSLDHAIDMDEHGNTVGGNAWTNTETDGRAHDHRRDCGPGSDLGAVWGSSSRFESGRYGTVGATDSRWTMETNTACDRSFRLYCFEQ